MTVTTSSNITHVDFVKKSTNPSASQVYTSTTHSDIKGGGGDGGHDGGRAGVDDVSLATLTERVGILNKMFWALATAFGAAFLFFILRIDDRFDRVDEPVRQVQKDIASQGATLSAIDDKIERLVDRREERNAENEPVTSPRGK